METCNNKKVPDALNSIRYENGSAEPLPMHPDDYRAHFDWVTAKRCHEQAMGRTFSEKPVYFRLLGQSRTGNPGDALCQPASSL